jgi:hypothetical protein
MWIFTNQAFLSIVSKDCDDSELLVRARREGDIQKVFPKAHVEKTVGVDYLYRARIDRMEVAAVIAKNIDEIDYSNFKGSIPYTDKGLSNACSSVWHVMAKLQPIPPYSFNRLGKI